MRILEAVQAYLTPGYDLLSGSFEDAPAEKGAYALILPVAHSIALPWRKQTLQLPAGCYVYAGNANGAGGIRGRLRHHLRSGKRPHWHVDHLTNAARLAYAFIGIAGSECDVVARLSAANVFEVPLAGFGSSDCRTCSSHLLRYAGHDNHRAG